MTGLELFNPSNALTASGLTGPDGAKTLLQAAQGFPGGPVMLVFALFYLTAKNSPQCPPPKNLDD